MNITLSIDEKTVVEARKVATAMEKFKPNNAGRY